MKASVFHLTLFALLLCALAPISHAQGPAPTPPPDPQIKELPVGSKLVIRFSQELAQSGRRNVQSNEIQKGPEWVLHATNWSDGRRMENWHRGLLVVHVNPFAREKVTVTDVLPDSDLLPSKNDFPELAWVTAACFVKSELYRGRKANIFQIEATVESIKKSDAPRQVPARTAWIDAETRLPIALQTGELLQEYTVSQLSAPLTLPPILQASVTFFEERVRADRALRVRVP